MCCLFGEKADGLVERQFCRAAAAPLGPARLGVVDEDVAHHLRGEAEELRAVLPVDAVLTDESQVYFVDQGRGLQRVVGVLAPQVGLGEAAKLGVDQRQKGVQSLFVTLARFD
jgi:hypothetical protein